MTSRYIVRCTTHGCTEPAAYKIAAEWSDGSIKELKTYGLACEQHVESLFRASREKQGRCRLTEGESLSSPRIFRLQSGQRDPQLERLESLEQKLA
jgi:hypothetical protein